jgi:low temperature requirement protein LtrA
MAVTNAVAAIVFLASTLGGERVRLILSAIGLAVAVAPSVVLWIRLPRFTSESEEHFVERMGAFTLIVCGESFIEVAITVSRANIARLDLVSLGLEFILTFTIFTVYFADAPRAGLQQQRIGWWVFGHLLAMIGIAGSAIGTSQLVDITKSHHIRDSEILKLGGSLALFFVAFAVIGICGRRHPARPLLAWRLGTALLIVVVSAIAWRVSTLHLAEALPILTAIVVLHAVGASWLRRTTSIAEAEGHEARHLEAAPLS